MQIGSGISLNDVLSHHHGAGIASARARLDGDHHNETTILNNVLDRIHLMPVAWQSLAMDAYTTGFLKTIEKDK